MPEFESFNERVAEQMLDSAIAAGGLSGYLGFRHIEFTAGRLVAEMEAAAARLFGFVCKCFFGLFDGIIV